MTTTFLNQLNDAQRQAVSHTGSPLLILAGAGSGKTRALTYRAAHLLSQKIPPDRILLTTFTNKAAQEMQARLESLTGQRLPFAGTFHSLCARFLRLHGPQIRIDRDFVIYDPQDQESVIKQAISDLNVSPKDYKPRTLLNLIEQAKHQLLSPDEYASFAKGPLQQTAARVYARYQHLLREYNALDFNDLLLETVNLFQTASFIRDRYQEQFLHVLIDEYQDTNRAQYTLTQLWGGKHQNLCVVGDASQAIYSWRGADYRNLIQLQTDYPNLTTIKLEQNYRSTQNILDAAHGVIGNNTLHPVLSLWTQSEAGENVTVYQAADERAESRYALEIIKARSPSTHLHDHVVLYRTNAQSRVLEEAFINAGIPYVLVGGVKFYQRREVKDILAYLRFTLNQKDQVSAERIQKLGKRRLASFNRWLKTKADLNDNPLKLLDAILSTTTYLDKFDEKDPEDAARIENVKELRSVAQNFKALGEFLENVALVEQDTGRKGWISPSAAVESVQQDDAVICMTMHASKGLEFDTVIMIGMEEGLFPHSRALMSKDELEEERRLCYVGMTRAKRALHLAYTQNRLYFGSRSYNAPSRFLSEIPEAITQSANGQTVPTATKTSPIDMAKLDAFLNDDIDIDEFLRG